MEVFPAASLSAALSNFVSLHATEMSPYAWKVGEAAWRALGGVGFDHNKFGANLPRQNIELKRHLSNYWMAISLDEQIRIAQWIVSDWGGIHRNTPTTILGYVNQANAERPATPFYGIASYSKILAIKDPEKYAVFDARVAASLDAIQLILRKAGALTVPELLAFPIPPGRNEMVNRFAVKAFPIGLQILGFGSIPKDAVYETYLRLLHATAAKTHKSILEVEMYLFAQADDLCRNAQGLFS